MSSVDSAIVFLPRFTALAGATIFTTAPMDVSSYGGVQFQLWRGPFRTKTASPAPKFTAFLEESLDTETWVLGPSVPAAQVIEQGEIKFFSYSFRLRWFRLKILVQGDEPIVSCWAEGLLRGGGDGVWPSLSGRPVGEITDGARTSTKLKWDWWADRLAELGGSTGGQKVIMTINGQLTEMPSSLDAYAPKHNIPKYQGI